MKNFGETLKRLRKERDMTQEQLAEYVNISPQSVSKWETGLTLPDISIIPMLANIFDVSADILLGIDITKKKQQIEKISNEANTLLFAGQFEEAEKLLRGALKQYPNSYELMLNLSCTIRNIAYHNKERQKELTEEEIALHEKILEECTDDKIRHTTIMLLCQTYCTINENEKAMKLAEKMPTKSSSHEDLLYYILKGTKKFEHTQKDIANTMLLILNNIMYMNDNPLDDETYAYNTDEIIALYHKIIDIINILCEDENFGNFNNTLYQVHLRLYYSNTDKDNTAALKHLQLCAKHAILFDAIPQTVDVGAKEYTSLLFRGLKVGTHKYIAPESTSQFLLNLIESEDYDYSHLPANELDAIKEELRKHTLM